MKFQLSHVITVSFVLLLYIPYSVSASDEFNRWLSQEQQQFKEYRDERDQEFTHYLKTQWREMQVFQGLVRDATPKPDIIPVAQPVTKSDETITIPLPDKDLSIPEPSIHVVTTDTKEPVIPKLPGTYKGDALDIYFYGHDLRFYYDPHLIYSVNADLGKTAISKAWSAMSQADFESFNIQLEHYRMKLSLNDWGYALLLHTISSTLHKNPNNQSIFVWFFMIKAGYKSRIAYDNNYIYLLLPTLQPLFSTPYFIFNDIRFYAIPFTQNKRPNPQQIFTYNTEYPRATKLLDMNVSHKFLTIKSINKRDLSFNYNSKDYHLSITFNKYLINYLATYPQLDISMYFKTQIDSLTAESILLQLKKLITGMSDVEAVNFILRFVQTSFAYKTDIQQFGAENYLFPEETLYYPYSDCEDRSVFFAWLVSNLLDLDVVGLDYPGHISVAVNFKENIFGDSVTYNNKKYIITDPTYTNASAGVTMPQYKNISPKIIMIN